MKREEGKVVASGVHIYVIPDEPTKLNYISYTLTWHAERWLITDTGFTISY